MGHVKVLRDYVQDIIDTRRAERSNDGSTEKKDILSLFIHFAKEANDEALLSDEHLRDVILNFMVAGRDTTACATMNLFKLLATNDAATHRLREELAVLVP